MSAFAANVLEWHDFFLASAGASAALLGLLFVGVSINLSAIAAAERVDLRARSGQAFTNLIFVLLISLILLVPDPDPRSLAASLGAIALVGLIRLVRNLVRTYREGRRFSYAITTLRRIGWSVAATALLLFTAWRLLDSQGQAAVLINAAIVVFVLLVGAADISWELLTEVSREATP